MAARLEALKKWRVSDSASKLCEEETEKLLNTGENLKDSQQISKPAVDHFCHNADALVQKARDKERDDLRRWDIAERLHRAFTGSGFKMTKSAGSRENVGGADIRLTHEAQGNLSVKVSTRIPEDQSIHLDMRGASGEDAMTAQPAKHCDSTLQDIIARAKAVGFILVPMLCVGMHARTLCVLH